MAYRNLFHTEVTISHRAKLSGIYETNVWDKFHISWLVVRLRFYIHLVKTSERHSLVQFSWVGQGRCGIYIRQESFRNKPIQRDRDFGCQLNSARKRYQESIHIHSDAKKQAELRDAYFNEWRNYHKKCRKLERSYWSQQKQDFSNFRSRDPKEFWKKLNLKPKSKSYQFTKSDLFDYHEKLASSQVNKDQYAEFDYQQKVEIEELKQTTDQILNAQFTFDEIKTMLNKLKSRRAAGIDKIIGELLKNLDDDTVIILINIFNNIFDSGEFPEEWALGIIVILFKGGERDDLNNYRGITLLSIVGKRLVGVLNERLTKFDESIELLHENQACFRKGYRTTDHTFTLFSIINHSLNVRKKPLYICFVDFK